MIGILATFLPITIVILMALGIFAYIKFLKNINKK